MSDAPESYRSTDLVRIRRNPWVMGLAASPLLGTIAAIITAITRHPMALVFTIHTIALALFAIVYAWRRNPWPVLDEVPVRAGAEGVEVGSERVPRAEIRDGFVLPGATPRVMLRRRWATPIELQMGSTHDARSLLRALGLDVSQSVATFRALSRALTKYRYIAAIAVSFVVVQGMLVGALSALRAGPFVGAAAGFFMFLSIVAMVTTMLMPTKLSVGADGLVLRWFFRDRFLGYGDIESVDHFERGFGRSRQVGLTLTLRSGERVALPIGQARWDDERVAIIGERIREAMESFRSGDAAADAALLQRGARDTRAWISALRSIGAGANAGMRTAPLPRERLFRIVESPAAPIADRAAAAVAISGEIDDDAQRRLRVAAGAIAAPKLRVVLEAAANGAPEAELEAALVEAAIDAHAKA